MTADYEHSIKPFPIRAHRQANGLALPTTYIPWYLAEIAFARWSIYNDATRVPIERLAELGGFGPLNYLDLMAGGPGVEPFVAFYRMMANRMVSVKDRVQIVVAGSDDPVMRKSYEDAMREIASEKAKNGAGEKMVFFQGRHDPTIVRAALSKKGP